MVEKATVTVKVPVERRDDWKEYAAESPEYSTMSHLIRQAVENEISGKYDLENRRANGDGGEASGEVLTVLRRVESSIDGLDDRLNAVEEGQEVDSTIDPQKAVYSLLEPVAWGSEPDETDLMDHKAVLSSRELAEKLGADLGRIEDTLQKMAEGSGLIEIYETDSGLIYAWEVAK